MIESGAKAPLFKAPSTQGEFRLVEWLERGPLVLYFFPKSDTPG